jgi:hypothetical protein
MLALTYTGLVGLTLRTLGRKMRMAALRLTSWDGLSKFEHRCAFGEVIHFRFDDQADALSAAGAGDAYWPVWSNVEQHVERGVQAMVSAYIVRRRRSRHAT